MGRFISEDPIGFDGGDVNLMAYVGNNPVNSADPLGLLGPFGPGFKNVRWPSQNPYLPGPDTEYGDPQWMRLHAPSLTGGKAIPGQWGAAAAAVALPPAIAGGAAIGGGLAFGPGAAALAVRSGIIYILGNPRACQIAVEVLTNVSTSGPPTPSQTGASYVGKAIRFGYTELAKGKGF